MRLRRRIALSVLGVTVTIACIVALAYARRERISAWVRVRLEAEVSRILGGEVRISRLDVDPLALRADFAQVDVVVPSEGSVPLVVSLESGRVRFAWWGLLSLPAGRVHLRELVLHHPAVSLDRAFLDGRRRGRGREPHAVDLRIDRFEVIDGTLLYEDRTVPFAVQTEDVRVRGEWDRIGGCSSGRRGSPAP